MARLVYKKKINGRKPTNVIIGKQIIEIVTSGMYSNPLMALREYIQNSVDSIDEAENVGLIGSRKGMIDVELDGNTRTIRIMDNGVGVKTSSVEQILCSIGHSTKPTNISRGFRGIGRLGGLGYCEKLVFETRHAKEKIVSTVTWDCRKLRKVINESKNIKKVKSTVRQVAKISKRKASLDDLSHFFCVAMHNVHRFHKDELMNIPTVKSYLSRVSPVGFDESSFLYAEEIDSHLSGLNGYRTYQVKLNGSSIYRPHNNVFKVSGSKIDAIREIELFEIPGTNGKNVGKGWFAHTNYLASIPRSVGMRGIRVRQGNIEVGDEYYLADVFTERRFATWHIGEIHLNYTIKSNARRDGFEQSDECQSFLEQANTLGRHLSHLCRSYSKIRSTRTSQERRLESVENLLNQPLIIDENHFLDVLELAEETIEELERTRQLKNGHTKQFYRRLEKAKKRFHQFALKPPVLRDMLDGRSLRHLSPKELLESVARNIINCHSSDKAPEQLVAEVMSKYLR